MSVEDIPRFLFLVLSNALDFAAVPTRELLSHRGLVLAGPIHEET